jgi:hypothetical protein
MKRLININPQPNPLQNPVHSHEFEVLKENLGWLDIASSWR